MFREGWNHHRIRTAQHQSPHQLFVSGILRLHSSDLSVLDLLSDIENN